MMEKENIPKEKALIIFKKMCFNRNFEKEVKKTYDLGKIKIPIYLSLGQESLPSTISEFFKPDLIFTQHRGHSVYLSFGGNKDKLVDELLGRDTGCHNGKGGSPGIGDPNIGMIGHHGLIGENVPLAVGASLGDSSKKIICFFGDGAAEEDYVFTSIAFANFHKLPIVFICEDNNLSILTEKNVRRDWELADALKAIGMNSVNISDDPEEIAFYINKFQDNLPLFINAKTCRHLWHVGTGQDGIPRMDRLKIFKQKLLEQGASLEELENIEIQTKKEAEELWHQHLQKQ